MNFSAKSILRVTCKVLIWSLVTLVSLLVIIMCAIAWILTPERLTPLVEKYASEYLLADVKADRVELTVWKSFPYVEIDVQNLHLKSRALQGQPDSVMRKLPSDAAKLLDASSIHASINPWHMLARRIKLGDIEIKGLGVNLVAYSPKVANYLITPPSEEKEEESAPWHIALADINISAPGGIRYFNAEGGIDVQLLRPQLEVSTKDDLLTTSFKTSASLLTQGKELISNMPFTLEAPLTFTQSPEMALSSPDVNITFWGVPLRMAFALDMGKKSVLKKFEMKLPPVKILPLVKLILPELYARLPELKGLDSDIAFGLEALLSSPWQFDSPSMPSLTANFTIPPCYLTYTDAASGSKTKIDELNLSGTFIYDGAHPEASLARIPVFTATGDGIDLALTAEVNDALSGNPLLRLTSKGTADISRFRSLIPLPGAQLAGKVNADASVQCRLADLTEARWEKLDASGKVEIRNLLVSLPIMATKLYAGMTMLTFGNDMAGRDAGTLVRGMLRARADIDTIFMGVPGIEVGMRGLDLRAGTTPAMLSMSAGNKEIMPIGMKMKVGRIVADSEVDTLHINARSLSADGRITRFQGNARSPLLQADLASDRLRYTDPLTRLGVKNFAANMTAHLRERKKRKTGNRPRNAAQAVQEGTTLDMSVKDEGLKSLLKQWGVQGGVKADRVNFTYISYPVRTVIRNLALDFTLDSLRLHRATIKSQSNSLHVSGTIDGMRRALLGRNRRPLKVRLQADIDSLDINQIAYNYTLGQGLMAKRGVLARINPEDEDALVRAAAELPAKEEEPIDTTTFIVPRNVDAQVKLTSKFARYTNLSFYDLHGNLVINDGAVSIDSLMMHTDFGDAYLNLLYSSRDINDLNMAVDLGLSRVYLKDFYTSFPAVTEMMPVITNLNGMVGAYLTGSFNLYPSMDIDLGSVNAMLNITGKDLRVTQNPLIRKVARMMLIRKKGDLNISDMNIQVSVHDNVMRLYPFSFSMEKYKFALLGENDLDQNMYYHLSVLKSPIPWKFGINIKGTFDKPKFRFGGAKYHENEAREVVNLVQSERVNFVKAMRLQLRKLVNKAALNYADRHEPDESTERKDQSMKDTEYEDPTQVISKALTNPMMNVFGKSSSVMKELQEKSGKKDKKKKK